MLVKYEKFIVLCNGFFCLLGNIVKILGYLFYVFFLKKCFMIFEFSFVKFSINCKDKINCMIW